MVSQAIKMVVVREREVVGSLLWSSNGQVPSAVWKPNPIRNINAYLIMMSFLCEDTVADKRSMLIKKEI